MKKILLILLIVCFSLGRQISAQTKVASPTALLTTTISPSDETEIKAFKDKIANVIKKNDKAVSGFVISKESSVINIKSTSEIQYTVKLDNQLTKYFKILGTTKKEIKADDISKGDYIIVTGVITDKTVTANSIFVDENFLIDSGRITEIDKDNYSIKVVNNAKETYSLDIENTTKQSILNIKTLEIEKTGFSKIKEGDTVHFVVKETVDSKDNKYSATKVLIIPQEYFIK